MSRNFPSHLDPFCFTVSDFEDPYEAFFWLGYFAWPRNPGSVEEIGEPVPQACGGGGEPTLPLCELADFCAFDTETSGLSGNDCAIQTAIGFFRSDGTAMGFYNKLWKLPPGGKVSTLAMRVHKITDSMLERDGCDAAPEIEAVHRIFETMKRRGRPIVAHNASFDLRMLKQTAARHGFSEWLIETQDIFCTMQRAKQRCGLVSSKTGRPKAPSNAELYEILSGEKPQGPLHDAVFDIKVTGRSFFLGARRGWW